MRKIAWVFAILVVVGILFSGNIFAEEGPYKVLALQGKVLIKKAGTENWIEAKIGDMLNKSDSIKTLEDGSVYIETAPKVGFTLGPNSILIVEDALEPPLVAEPYTEPARDRIENVVAPEVNQESAASRI